MTPDSSLPVVIVHGEGRAEFSANTQVQALVALNYVDNDGAWLRMFRNARVWVG